MKSALVLGLAAAALFGAPFTSGPYTDSAGTVWTVLPSVADHPDAASFDARFGNEVFTTAFGDRFQLDRPWTDAERAEFALLAKLIRDTNPDGHSGGALHASVTTHHPVDEEFAAMFGRATALKKHVLGVVEMADNGPYANWGFDLIPSSGSRWDSNDTSDLPALLDEAFAECGGVNGHSLMIAFTADPTPSGAIGIAHLGEPKLLVSEFGGQNVQAANAQHQLGHAYTLEHCCDPDCIMQAVLDPGAFGLFHAYVEGCSGRDHFSQFESEHHRY